MTTIDRRQLTLARSRLLMIGAGLLLVGGLLVWNISQETQEPVALASVAYVQSPTCMRCHEEHYRSWQRTFHRTMTQLASPTAIQGDFANASYTFQGITSRFTTEAGRFFIETLGPDRQMERFEVVMTVGSRRFQQYVTRLGDRHFRLPLAWNIEESRWFHLNGGFLYPDGTDFNNHTALWDANCIFCHNVKADPGADWAAQTFDSQVAELGIACEACHGPGQEHISRNSNPLRRYFLHLTGQQDPTLYSPYDLPQAQQVQLCGHCHGQRLPNPPERIQEFLTEGDPYTAGDDLNQYTAPLWIDTKAAGLDFSLRFWPDGTPRLTAYEYQGLLQSVDYQQGQLTCISCHSLHDGDPKGMIKEEMRGPQACLQCHPDLGYDIPAHTKHEATSSGSDCYSCHMPKITYGLLNTHPTHRIQNPEPARAWRYDMPEACTLCHTNQTARWAATNLSQQYQTPLPQDMPSDAMFDLAENIRALLAGNVIQRAVAIAALSDERSYTEQAEARLWATPFLLISMEDNYPAIRHFAYRSLKILVQRAGYEAPLATDFDPLADKAERDVALRIWQDWWANLDKTNIPHPGPAVPLDQNLQPMTNIIIPLLVVQDNTIIAIGE